jgi:transposase
LTFGAEWLKSVEQRGWEQAPKRGRKPKHVNPLQEEINRLKQELERERKAQVRAEAIVEVQKKYPRCWA